MDRIALAFAGIAGALAVAGDAAAAHLLAGDAYRMELAQTAARYALVHAAALLALGLWLRQAAHGQRACLAVALGSFIGGLVLFCGRLGLIAGGFSPGLARAVPLGGTLFILGWLAVFVAAVLPRRSA
jgi:uncharacterized membrane protein YgdD (TMEM256/DUF423 family)